MLMCIRSISQLWKRLVGICICLYYRLARSQEERISIYLSREERELNLFGQSLMSGQVHWVTGVVRYSQSRTRYIHRRMWATGSTCPTLDTNRELLSAMGFWQGSLCL